MKRNKPILILGLGNDILCDDGIAIKIINELQKKNKSPNIHFRTLACGGMAVVEEMSGYEEVIIIDAIKTMDGIPGKVYHFTPETFKQTSHISSFHDISFLTALKFIRYIGQKIPKRIEILAIEIDEDMIFGDCFSEIIREKYHIICQKIEMEVKKIIKETNLIKTKTAVKHAEKL